MKNYKELVGFLFLLMIFSVPVEGQELTIGDALPDYTFNSVLRYPSPSVQLGAFRGKILVLNFWRTTCGHAVASFRHFDSLQNEFPGQLVTLTLTTESRKRITDYLANNEYARQTIMPVVTDDSILAGKRISFFYIPHVVLVNEQGVIVAITEPEKITDAIIRKLLQKEAIELPLKHEVTDFDYSANLFAEGKGRNLDRIAYTSIVTHQLPGVFSINSVDTSGGRTLYKAYNQSIPNLYAQAYHIVELRRNRLILDVADASRFDETNHERDALWQADNLWCYNLLLPNSYQNPGTYAVADFDRFFGVTGRLEKRKLNCLLLVKKGTKERWRSKGGREYFFMDSANYTLIHNVILRDITSAWNAQSPIPILDETGMAQELTDMKLANFPVTSPQFRKQLQAYDLDLVPAVKELEVLLIKDAKVK